MKKIAIINKKQITLAIMVLGLAAAVWLNMKYSAASGNFNVAGNESDKIFGQTDYVSNNESNGDDTLQVGANGYFSTAKADREVARLESIEQLKEAIENVKTDDASKTAAIERIAVLTKRTEDETAIENLVKAKNFNNVIAIIGDDSVSVVVEGESLLDSEVQQIKDIVISQTGISLEKIKILAVK